MSLLQVVDHNAPPGLFASSCSAENDANQTPLKHGEAPQTCLPEWGSCICGNIHGKFIAQAGFTLQPCLWQCAQSTLDSELADVCSVKEALSSWTYLLCIQDKVSRARFRDSQAVCMASSPYLPFREDPPPRASLP